jgi:general secretion pathway protein N
VSRYLEWPRIITSVLIVGCVACALAILLETDWGREWRRDVSLPAMGPAKSADAAMLPPFKLSALESGFSESAERPLFMPTRRPVPAATAVPAMKRGQFQLVGTSRTKEFGDSAMLKDIATNKTSVVKVGTTIKDMTLESVGPDKVVLKLGEEAEELVMKAQAKPGASAGIPAARPPGAAAMPSQPSPAATSASAPGAGIFGGASPASGPQPAMAQPAPSQIVPGAPGSPTVFPGAPGSNINAPAGSPGASAQPRAPTPEEILERRRRARAQQAQ